MVSNQNNFHQKLVEDFAELKNDFNKSLQEAKTQEDNFKHRCNQFNQNVQHHLEQTAKKLPATNPLSNQIKAFTKQVETTNAIWQDRIKAQDKGVRFREGFNDSLLVFVFGKVKSGKSSLGNYVAWGNTDPDETLKNNTPKNRQPVYSSHAKTDVKNGDSLQEAEKNREFRVGATEATSSIQGFTLPGLTWIDSPGLHSINQENEQLAKDYVEHSDLILYTMRSDAVGRDSDIQEIGKLYRADKRILILITGSDTTEEDVDDNDELITKTIMKSADTQKLQHQAVRTALESVPELKGKTENIEIVSFSARYAQLHANDPKEFEESGMKNLFDVLSHTAKAEGIKLKQNAPLRNFRNFLTTFKKDLNSYEDLVSGFEKPIASLQRTIPNEISKHTRMLQREMSDLVSKEFSKLDSLRNDKSAMSEAVKSLEKKLQNELLQRVSNAKRDITTQIGEQFQGEMADVAESSSLFKLPEFQIQQKKEKIFASVRQGTKSRNSGIGAMIGGVLGGIAGSVIPGAGTLAGASIGSMLGGLAGSMSGDDATPVYEEITVNVGDNLADIRQKTEETIEQLIEQLMDAFEKQIIDSALNEAHALLDNIKHEIDLVQTFFDKQTQEIDIKLK